MKVPRIKSVREAFRNSTPLTANGTPIIQRVPHDAAASPPPSPQDRMTRRGEPLPTLHPEGTFTAEFVKFGDVNRTLNGAMFRATAEFQTEHGKLYVVFVGTLDTVQSSIALVKFYAERSSFGLKVKHRPDHTNYRVWPETHIVWEKETP